MPKDKVIQSGQFTLSRILLLAAAAGVIVAAVALGGVFLSIGYSLVTLAICVLLYLIAIDYGVDRDKMNPQAAQATVHAAAPEAAIASEAAASAGEPRVRRPTKRPAKRRR